MVFKLTQQNANCFSHPAQIRILLSGSMNFLQVSQSITVDAVQQCFGKMLDSLQRMFYRLQLLKSKHISFYLLRNCFTIPTLTYLLRNCPNWLYDHNLTLIDMELKPPCLQKIINNNLDERRTVDVGISAFLASVNTGSSLVGLMLNRDREASLRDSKSNAWLYALCSLTKYWHSSKK